MLQFEQDEMEIMRKSGQVIGKIADNYISDLYQLDRTRSAEELIRQLKNISLRAISMGKKSDESNCVGAPRCRAAGHARRRRQVNRIQVGSFVCNLPFRQACLASQYNL